MPHPVVFYCMNLQQHNRCFLTATLSTKRSLAPYVRAVAMLLLEGAAMAQTAQRPADQSFALNQQPLLYTPTAILAKTSPADLPAVTVIAVIDEALKQQGAKRTDGTYYVLHMIQHANGKPESATDAWYVYTNRWSTPKPLDGWNDPDLAKHYAEGRMFGARTLSMIYVHYGVPAGTPTMPDVTESVKASWQGLPGWFNVNAEMAAVDSTDERLQLLTWADLVKSVRGDTAFTKAVTAADKGDVSTEAGKELWKAARNELAKLAKPDRIKLVNDLAGEKAEKLLRKFFSGDSGVVGPNGQELVKLGSRFLEKTFLPISYSIDVTRKTPSVFENLQAVAGAFMPQFAIVSVRAAFSNEYALSSVKLDMAIEYPTSNIQINGFRGTTKIGIGSKAYLNERKYWVDFSFGVPLRQLKELSFADSQFAPVARERSRIYGLVNIFPLGPVDTGASKIWRFAPQLLYGMALNKTPWSNHLFAVGFGTKYVQPFVGTHLNRNLQPGSSQTNPVYRWGTQLAVGINVQASGLAKLIKGAGK